MTEIKYNPNERARVEGFFIAKFKKLK